MRRIYETVQISLAYRIPSLLNSSTKPGIRHFFPVPLFEATHSFRSKLLQLGSDLENSMCGKRENARNTDISMTFRVLSGVPASAVPTFHILDTKCMTEDS